MNDHVEKTIDIEPRPDQPQAEKRPVRRRRRYSGRRRSKTAAAAAGKPPAKAITADSENMAAGPMPDEQTGPPEQAEPLQAEEAAGQSESATRAERAAAEMPAPEEFPEEAALPGQAEPVAQAEPAERMEPADQAEPAALEQASPPAARKRRHRGGRRRRRRSAGSPAQPAGLPAAAAETQASGPQSAAPAASDSAGSASETPAATPRRHSQPGQPERPPAASPARPEIQAAGRSESEAKPAPDMYRVLKYPGLDAARAKKGLLDFIWEQRELTGSGKAVVGLSGGLDSIVTAALTVEALGRNNVQLYFFMDGDRYNVNEKERARLVASRLGCQLEVRDLRPHLNLYFEQETQVPAERRSQRLAWEIAAWLSDYARQQSALLAGSYNKTKRLLGLWPFYPLAASWNLLGDIYHSQMRDLARHLNIPPMILDQSQERRDLPVPGFSLNLADGLLYQMVDLKISLARLIDLGQPEEKIGWLYRWLKTAASQQKYPLHPEMVFAYAPRAWTGTAET